MTSQSQREYSDGSVYDGEWNDEGEKHGRGSLTYSSGSHYTGQFERGLHSGAGVLTVTDAANKYVVHSTLCGCVTLDVVLYR